ncbi:MAG: isopeptide-forming domain-containing fimbrial protein [Anaerolineales bacterium]
MRDELPAGFKIPTGGAGGNLSVTRGDGTSLSIVEPGTANPADISDLFGLDANGIELVDPAPDQGACQVYSATSGANIVVIAYDLQISDDVPPGQEIPNTATVFNYANEEGGEDFTGNDSDLTDVATVTIDLPQVDKTFVSTNQAHTSDRNVAIGEQVSYRVIVTVPEGEAQDVVLRDTLDAGLAFVSIDSLTGSSAITSDQGDFDDIRSAATFSSFGSGETAPGRRATLNFGTLTNSDTDNTTDETITVEYTAVVLNSANNDRTDTRSNNAQWRWTANGGTESVTAVAQNATIVEPLLQVIKSASPTSGDAGDTITFTLVVSHTGSSDADTFELELLDDIPTGTTYVTGSLQNTSGEAPVTLTEASGTINATWSGLQNGQASTLQFQVTLDSSVSAGQVITNTGQVEWTSLPGDVTTAQTSNNALSVERTGDITNPGGSTNDHLTTDSTNVTIFSAPTKSVDTTSESHTSVVGGEERLAIGEIVRYRLVFRLAEGTNVDFQLQDRLPAGMRFIDDSTATVAFVANGSTGSPTGISSSTLGTSPQESGNETNFDSIDPTFTLPDAAVSASASTDDDTYGSGTDVYFKLGTLTNNDRDEDEEYVVLEFNALVENVDGNQAYDNNSGTSSPTELENDFRVWVDGTVIATSAIESVWVAEPAITNVTKTATTAPGDAGDTVVYQIAFSNQATGSDGAAAYNLRLTDSLDPNLNSASVTDVTVSDPSDAAVTDNSSGLNIDVLIGQLNPGGTVTVQISALVDDDAPIAATISNEAQLTYTSLPEESGTTSNLTGSSTPGTAGTPTGERTGGDGESGALNDYADSADLDLSLDDPAISKVVTDSSVASTDTGQIDVSLTDLVIGENVTFTITATLPEGDSTITITDDLPASPEGVLSLVSSEVISIGGSISGSSLAVGDAGVHSDEDSDGFNDRVVFIFGSLHNQPDGSVTSDDQLVMEVVALVENLAANQNEDQLTNTATINHDNGSQSVTADVEIVEPVLQISKTADDDTPALGQTVIYTVTVEHLSDSHADAEDIVIIDTVPSGLSYLSDSASLPDSQVDESGDPVIEFTIPSLELADGSTSFTYQVVVDSPPSANVGDVLQNNQAMTWTSIDGTEADETDERDGSGGVDDYSASTNESVTVTGIDLTILKDDGGATAVPGDVIIYTLTYENVGNTGASGVVISETVPQSTSFNNANSTSGWNCTGTVAGSTCTFTVGTLAPDTPATVDFAVQVVSPAPAGLEQIYNSASISDDGNNGPEPTPANNSDSDVTPVGAVPDLAITKDDGQSIISDGTVLIYQMLVDNLGNQDATGVVVTDTVPVNTTFNPGSSSDGWSCTPDNSAGSTCTFDVGDLDAGDSVNLTFQVTVDNPLPDGVTAITNVAQVQDDGSNGPDPDDTNNTDDDIDNIATDVNTDLTKALVDTNQSFTNGTSVAIGEIITYELVLTVPEGTMSDAVLTDTLDQGLAFVECESMVASTSDLTSTEGAFDDICDSPTVTTVPSGSGNTADAGRGLSFDLGDLENISGSDATLTIRYLAAVLNAEENDRGDQRNNTAEVDWTGDGLSAAAAEVTIVEPTLSLEKSVSPQIVLQGGLVTFTLIVEHTNASDADSFDLVLEDMLPSELVYESATLAWTGAGLAPDALDDSLAPRLQIGWDSFPQGSQSEVQYSARLSGVGPGESVSNDAFLEWSSLPGDVTISQSAFNGLATERIYDPGSPVNIYGVGDGAQVRVPALPATGYAPNRITDLGQRPTISPYQDLGEIELRIQKIGVQTEIVGVSTDSEGWDLTWLSNQAGYLEGTAYPTLPGNTALTAHVYLADGTPGPFHRLKDLAWGDEITLESGGSLYTYQVRQVARVLPRNLSVLRNEDLDWLTLITCEGYYEPTDTYLRRLVVRAVLVSAEPILN